MNRTHSILIAIILILGLSCNQGTLLVDGKTYSGLSIRADGNISSITNEKGKFKISIKNKKQDSYIFYVDGRDSTSYGIVHTMVSKKRSELRNLEINVSPVKLKVDSVTIHLIEAELRKIEKYLDSANISLNAISSLLDEDDPLVPRSLKILEEHSATVDAYTEYVNTQRELWQDYKSSLHELAEEFEGLDGNYTPKYLRSSLQYITQKARDVEFFYDDIFQDLLFVKTIFNKEHFLNNIHFKSGKYLPSALKEWEKVNLDKMFDTIMETRSQLSGFDKSEIILELKLIGSADGASMSESIEEEFNKLRSDLASSTMQIINFEVKDGREDKNFDTPNYYLSLCRAISIGNYLIQKFESYQISVKIVGKGRISQSIDEKYRKCSVSFTFYRKENQSIIATRKTEINEDER